jgi:hypothetical protein
MKKHSTRNASGEVIRCGHNVVLFYVGEDLLFGLPSEDIRCIRKQVGRIVKVLNIEENDMVEVEFTDDCKAIHSIWVSSDNLVVDK